MLIILDITVKKNRKKMLNKLDSYQISFFFNFD